jgi:hypothetical protein
MERDHCISATHRETYFPRLVKHVAGDDGGKFNFVSPEGKPTTFTLREAYNAMEMLEMRWGEKWSFEVIHIEAIF